jgi:hypothetical protein
VTKIPRGPRCRWCGRNLANQVGPGRPRAFCAQACRQKDYIARLRAQEAGLSEAELVVTREELDALHDQLYVLEAAIEDVERDLALSTNKQDYVEALDWLLDAYRPLIDRQGSAISR